MDIRVYLYNDYDAFGVKILEILKKCNLKYSFGTYNRNNLDYVSEEIGEKVRKLPQVVIDGKRIGGHYDLMEYLMNNNVINYKSEIL